jgi:type IV secretion system protein VirB10
MTDEETGEEAAAPSGGTDPGEAAGPSYETSPEEATGFEAAGFLNRKRIMMALCVSFALVAGGGFFINRGGPKEQGAEDAASRTARPPAEFLRSQRDRALAAAQTQSVPEEAVPQEPAALPAVYRSPGPAADAPPPAPAPPAPAAPPGRSAPDPLPSAYRSPLVPAMEGSLFARGGAESSAQYPYRDPQAEARAAAGTYLEQSLAARGASLPPASSGLSSDAYTLQNNQENKQAFYDPASGGGAAVSGSFQADFSLWTGTVVPGILQTGINTDLPGDVLARVTQNIYDSRTGSRLLIPQGSMLIARYNSSVSYAQSRVQIVWDTLIRPDGFQVDLGGMNSVDPKGFSGQEAEYHENWFEYLKAAGIVAMFSVANASMTAEAAKHASSETASALAQSNLEYVNQMAGGITGRAMNIQPTLTVDSGTKINIFLNRTLSFPPAENYRPSAKYIRE